MRIAEAEPPAAPLQTLSRGLVALELLAEAGTPLTIGELARRMGLHRSITYRIVRTLEQHGFVGRGANGDLRLGAGLAAVARGVHRDLQATALPELTQVANELGMTAFLVVHHQDEVVTLVSVEPRLAGAAVAQRPGTRQSLDRGAPGRAVGHLVNGTASAMPFEASHDEVVQGLSSVAVPLQIPGEEPAAIAVVYLTRPIDVSALGSRLERAAQSVRDLLG